jgi:hypothetical protein
LIIQADSLNAGLDPFVVDLLGTLNGDSARTAAFGDQHTRRADRAAIAA